jgi:hypothetical protein
MPSSSRFTNGDKRTHQSNLPPYLQHVPNARSAAKRANSITQYFVSDSVEDGTILTPSNPAAPFQQSSPYPLSGQS